MSKKKVSRKAVMPRVKDKGNLPHIKELPSHRPLSKILISLFLILSTLIIFWPLGNSEFIDLDDGVYVYAKPQVKGGLTVKGVIWAFTTLQAGFWHPLTWLSHMLDVELYGLKAGGHHWTNVLWHIASTLLLFLVLERMTGGLWRSGFVAALFALHPLHVESVAWVAERKDVLSTFFWMLTLWAYVRYTERPGRNRYLMVLSFFVLGLLSKSMLVTVPFVMLLLDYWPLGRMKIGSLDGHGSSPVHKSLNENDQRLSFYRSVLEKIPFFALAGVSSFLTFLAQKGGGAVDSFEGLPLEARLGNALVSYVSYIGKMIWPTSLAIFYPHPGMLPMWQVGGALLLLLGISVWVFRAARKHPYLGVGWLWYLGTLVPVIGLVQVGVYGMADRFTYVPLIGLFIMMAWGAPDILGGWLYRKAVLALSAGFLLSILIGITSLQIYLWRDTITLFTHTLNVTTRNYLIHNNLGLALAARGNKQEAVAHYAEALRIKPDYAPAHNNLGVALQEQGKKEKAIAHYTQALRIKPDYAEAHNNLGAALADQGKKEEAIAHYTQALRIKPDLVEAHMNLGNSLTDLGRIEEAIPYLTEALRITPDFAEAHFSLGMAYFMIGNRNKALEEYKILKTINPDLANALSQKISK